MKNMNKTSEVSHAAGISEKAVKHINILRHECITMMQFLAIHGVTNTKLSSFPKHTLYRGKSSTDDFASTMMQYNLIVVRQALYLQEIVKQKFGVNYIRFVNENTNKKGYHIVNVCTINYKGEDVQVENTDYNVFMTEILSHTRYIMETKDSE